MTVATWLLAVVIGMVFAATPSAEHDGNATGVFPLVPSVRAFENASILLSLPRASEDAALWTLYAGGAEPPKASGDLSAKRSVEIVGVAFGHPGTVSLVLIVRNATGEPTRIRSAKIEVTAGGLSEWVARASGPVAGALLAMLVVFMNEWVGYATKWRQRRRQLAERLRQVLRQLEEGVHADQRQLSLPDWLSNPGIEDWTVLLDEGSIRTFVNRLKRVVRQWNLTHYTPEKVRAEFEELRALL